MLLGAGEEGNSNAEPGSVESVDGGGGGEFNGELRLRFLVVDCPAVWGNEDADADIRPFCHDSGREKRVIATIKRTTTLGKRGVYGLAGGKVSYNLELGDSGPG